VLVQLFTAKEEHATGEANLTQFSTDYNNSWKVVTGPDYMTTPDSGSPAIRETMERPGTPEFVKDEPHDPRDPAPTADHRSRNNIETLSR